MPDPDFSFVKTLKNTKKYDIIYKKTDTFCQRKAERICTVPEKE